MIFVKYIILFLIFLGSCMIGVLISSKYRNRVKDLKEFKNALNILQTKIKFTFEPLGDIFEDIVNITYQKKEEKTKKGIYEIFKKASENLKYKDVKTSWEEAIETTKDNLNFSKEDLEIIKSLGNMLRKNRYRWSNK